LRQYEPLVKAGIPGMGYVRFDENVAWPVALQVKPLTNIRWSATGSMTRKE
jgi:HlyD family secretion protein